MTKSGSLVAVCLAAAPYIVLAQEPPAKIPEPNQNSAATRLSDQELDAITAGAFTQSFTVISNRGAADVVVSQPHHATCINTCTVLPPSSGKAIGLIFVFNGGRSPTTCINLPC